MYWFNAYKVTYGGGEVNYLKVGIWWMVDGGWWMVDGL